MAGKCGRERGLQCVSPDHRPSRTPQRVRRIAVAPQRVARRTRSRRMGSPSASQVIDSSPPRNRIRLNTSILFTAVTSLNHPLGVYRATSLERGIMRWAPSAEPLPHEPFGGGPQPTVEDSVTRGRRTRNLFDRAGGLLDLLGEAVGYPVALRGEVSERPKERDWKSRTRRKACRGFKSRPLR